MHCLMVNEIYHEQFKSKHETLHMKYFDFAIYKIRIISSYSNRYISKLDRSMHTEIETFYWMSSLLRLESYFIWEFTGYWKSVPLMYIDFLGPLSFFPHHMLLLHYLKWLTVFLTWTYSLAVHTVLLRLFNYTCFFSFILIILNEKKYL